MSDSTIDPSQCWLTSSHSLLEVAVRSDPVRRRLVLSGSLAAGATLAGAAAALHAQTRTDIEPRELHGSPYRSLHLTSLPVRYVQGEAPRSMAKSPS